MIVNFFDYFNSLNVYLILITCFLLYLYNRKKSRDVLEKIEEQTSIDSIDRRAEECYATYPNGWLPVYDSLDLKKGQVIPIFRFGRDLVIYRGTSNKVYVFDAYCPHLGANLGVGGTVVGDDIKCHFHGWLFDNQGDCKAIPGLKDISIPKTSIKKYLVEEVNDFIYVWHHSEQKEPDWFLPKFEQEERMTYRGKIIFTTYCHIQDFMENDSDLVHFDTIHCFSSLVVPKILQKMVQLEVGVDSQISIDQDQFTKSAQKHSRINISLKIFGFIKIAIELSTGNKGPAHLTTEIHINALFQINISFDAIVITIGEHKQCVNFKVYSDRTYSGYILSKITILLFPIFINQDRPIWNKKRWLRNPTFTKLDESVIKFRRWYKRNFYQDNSDLN